MDKSLINQSTFMLGVFELQIDLDITFNSIISVNLKPKSIVNCFIDSNKKPIRKIELIEFKDFIFIEYLFANKLEVIQL